MRIVFLRIAKASICFCRPPTACGFGTGFFNVANQTPTRNRWQLFTPWWGLIHQVRISLEASNYKLQASNKLQKSNPKLPNSRGPTTKGDAVGIRSFGLVCNLIFEI